MRWLAVVSLVIVVGCARGPGEAPRPEEPYGLPTGWRYIHGDGRHNSPCLGVVSDKDRPECVVDTMMACNAWQPDWERLQDGAPGYPYGPDWVDGYHPLCAPLHWSPYDDDGIHASDYHDPEPPLLGGGGMDLLAPRMGVVVYQVHGFIFPEKEYRPGISISEPGDLVVTDIAFICERGVATTPVWEEALAGDPAPSELSKRLPMDAALSEDECYEVSGPASATLRFGEGRWWVVRTFRVFHRTRWPLLEDFYRSIRK